MFFADAIKILQLILSLFFTLQLLLPASGDELMIQGLVLLNPAENKKKLLLTYADCLCNELICSPSVLVGKIR